MSRKDIEELRDRVGKLETFLADCGYPELKIPDGTPECPPDDPEEPLEYVDGMLKAGDGTLWPTIPDDPPADQDEPDPDMEWDSHWDEPDPDDHPPHPDHSRQPEDMDVHRGGE